MHLEPPIPRMNSPDPKTEHHHPKGCTKLCGPFIMLKNEIS